MNWIRINSKEKEKEVKQQRANMKFMKKQLRLHGL